VKKTHYGIIKEANMDINVVVLVGRLTREADMRSKDDKAIAKFSLAVNRMKKDEADFINCTAFGKTAEVVEKYTHKGSRVAVRGKIQTGSYTNKEGQNVYTTDVIVDDLQLLDQKSDEPPVVKDDDFATIGTQETMLPF
jgi:single-strand DNA-binding protein